MLVGWQLSCNHLTFDIPNEKSTHHDIFMNLYAMQAINQDWWERDSTETTGVALGAGAGFLGGAMAGVAAMSMYHRYRMYSSMMMYQSHGMGYGGYGRGYGFGHNSYGYGSTGQRGMLLADDYDCIGGCPMNAFCDYGICRCRTGYVPIVKYLQSDN